MNKLPLTIAAATLTLTAFCKWTPLPQEERLKLIAPAAQGELRVRPTFTSVGIVFGSEKLTDVALEYRVAGKDAAWTKAQAPVYFDECRNYRGSIMRLEENTEYELRIGGKSATFKTWASEVPVAKTVVIDPATTKFPLTIAAKGEDRGWIRYTAACKLVNAGKEPLIVVKGASHILLDDMVLEGGPACHVITIEDTDNIRIRNCEISKWGRVGKRNYDDRGRFCEVKPDGTFGRAINYDAAITIGKGTTYAVVERCYVHDPNGTSASWLYSHPAGPEAVHMLMPDHSTVLRWNDFVGSDVHRWNDAVEGAGNGYEIGGFNRDADVYGNFMFCSNDDCIELDGGQQNVRSFDNRYECALCGVSVQGCIVSPSYLLDDLFVNIVEENDTYGQTIKTSGYDSFKRGPYCFLTGLVGKGRCGEPWTTSMAFPERFIQTNCKYLQPLGDREWFDRPVRQVPFELNVGRIGCIRVANGEVSPKAVKVKVIGKGAETPFTVRVNDALDWMKVEPMGGTVKQGEEVVLTVTFDASKMVERRHFRGAFIVRMPNGLSRACTLDAETDYLMPMRPDPKAVYVNLPAPVKLKLNQEIEYEFEVPEKARYMIAAHGYALEKNEVGVRFPRMYAAVDGDELELYDQYCYLYPCWSLVVPGRGQGCRLRWYTLEPGKHKLRLKLGGRGFVLDALAITQDPEAFKQR